MSYSPLLSSCHLKSLVDHSFVFGIQQKSLSRELSKAQNYLSGLQPPSSLVFSLITIFCAVLMQSSIPNVTSLTWFTYNMFALYFFLPFPQFFFNSLWHWIAAFVECWQTTRIKGKKSQKLWNKVGEGKIFLKAK